MNPRFYWCYSALARLASLGGGVLRSLRMPWVWLPTKLIEVRLSHIIIRIYLEWNEATTHCHCLSFVLLVLRDSLSFRLNSALLSSLIDGRHQSSEEALVAVEAKTLRTPFIRRETRESGGGNRGMEHRPHNCWLFVMICLQLSSPQPSQIRSGEGPVKELFGGIRDISVRGAGRPPNPVLMSSSSNARNPIPDHICQAGVILTLRMHCIWSLLLQGPPAGTAPAPEQNTSQATNSGTAKVGQTTYLGTSLC